MASQLVKFWLLVMCSNSAISSVEEIGIGKNRRPNFYQCSKGCVCEPKNHAICINAGLSVIPQDLPPGIVKLDLTFNNLLRLDSALAHYVKLESLILTGNSISVVNSRSFDRLTGLIELKLSQNSIHHLADNSFGGLASLRFMDLSNNQLEELSSQLFVTCPNLHVLDLSHNKLKTLDQDVFKGVDSLQVLILKGNFFKEVPFRPFIHAQHLNELRLDNNDITSLSSSPFQALKQLSILSLNGNQLTSFNYYDVEGLHALRTLNLGQNKISQFPTKAFEQIEHLETLEIGLNYIEELAPSDLTSLKNLKHFSIFGCKGPLEIRPNAFHDNSMLVSVNVTKCHEFTELKADVFSSLPYLTSLNFHGCGLTSVDENAADWSTLNSFDLSKNPLTCDCKLQWLQNMLINQFQPAGVTCHLPEELTGQNLALIKDSLCDSSLTSGVLIGISGTVVILILLVIFAWYSWRNGLILCEERRPRIKRPKSLNSKADIQVLPTEPSDPTKYRDIENIYEDPEEMPLGRHQNYPDIKTTVL